VGKLEAGSRGGPPKAVLYSREMMDAFQFFRVRVSRRSYAHVQFWQFILVISC
jgi:hypothetical protein